MLVNNNRVYSSKLACLLSPCPTLGSRWCNVTAQFQHLPSLSNTGPGVPSRLGHVRNVVVCDTLATGHWPASVSCGSGTQLHSSPSCGAASVASDEAGPAVPGAGAGASPDYCVLSLPSVCLVTRLAWPLQPRWSCGLEDWKTLLLILLLSLDWTVWTNIGVTGSPTYCTAPLPPSSVSRRHV